MPDNCPACYNEETVFKKIRGKAVISWCPTCHLSFAHFNETDVIETDPDFYHGIDSSFKKQLAKARELLPRRVAEYEKYLDKPVKSVIEIGCATGAYARAFEELGISYTGVEIEEEVAKKARNRTQLNIIHSDFMQMEFNHSFDVFFCSQVLEHVPDPTMFIQHAKSVVETGLIHIDVPNHDGLTSNLRKIRHKQDYGFIQPPYHMIAYNSHALTNLFERNNLDIIYCRAFPNNDPIWGQLIISKSKKQKVIYKLTSLLNKGSLLSILAKV